MDLLKNPDVIKYRATKTIDLVVRLLVTVPELSMQVGITTEVDLKKYASSDSVRNLKLCIPYSFCFSGIKGWNFSVELFLGIMSESDSIILYIIAFSYKV
jgi:hypothetical protein